MVTIALVRRKNVLEEEYGRVLFDGKNIQTSGLSCVFVRYLERGLVDTHGMRYNPRDGAAFMRALRREFSSDALMAREV